MPLPREIPIDDLEDVLTRWGDELTNDSYEAPLRDCLPILHEDFEAHFYASMGDDGPWAPRKDSKPHPILILTGALIEAARDTGSTGNISEVSARELRTGVNAGVVNYAGFHQYGTRYMPARPYVWASEEALDDCLEAFADGCYRIFVLAM